MKVHLIKLQTIEAYAIRNASSKASFNDWINKVRYADWNIPSDIAATFGSADLLGNGSNRVVFDIGGNNFRMICEYHFGTRQVHLYINWIGTHAEYDKLCNDNKQYTIDKY